VSVPTVQHALAQFHQAYEHGQLAEAEAHLRQALALTRQEPSDRQAEKEILIQLGLVARQQGNISMAQDFLEDALNIARGQQDRRSEAQIMLHYGDVEHAVEDRRWIDGARGWYEDALQIMQELHDLEGARLALGRIGASWNELAEVLWQEAEEWYPRPGQLDEAKAFFEESLDIRRQLHDHQGEAEVLTNLGRLAFEQDQLEEAERCLAEALLLARTVHDRAREAQVLAFQADLADRRDQREEAERGFAEALGIEVELKNRAMEGVIRYRLGLLAHQRGALEEAERYLQEALAIDVEEQERAGEGKELAHLGQIFQQRGELAEATAYYQRACVIFDELMDREHEGDTRFRLGQVAQQRGQLQEAEDHYRRSLLSFQVAEYPHREGEVLQALGEVAQQGGQPEEAQRYFEQAQAIFKETTAPGYVRVVHKLDVLPRPRRIRS
jgi:tetratricopeptide (TPR) repeat protein